MTLPLAIFQQFGMQELLVLGGFALLLFGGRRLPEFGRSLGRGIVEFKKGLKGIEDDIDPNAPTDSGEVNRELPRPPQRVTSSGPKFDAASADKPTAHS
jgi:sec-independent protein translocase protein TatA